MSIITVGNGEEYATIAAAVAASQDGDVIEVNAGTYTNDFADITHAITLQAVGGVVNMVATEPLPNEKGILIVDNSVTIEGFSFTGAEIPASEGNNGAGIRYQSGNLTLIDDDFTNNQDGLLATPLIAGTGTIDIQNSEFANNGAGDGYSHNIYVGEVASFTFNQSFSHNANVGHDIKSRAETTIITNSRVEDGTATASYSIDLPNGGNALIQNDVVQQGANSQNPTIIAYGEEGGLYANSTLTVANNLIVNDLTAHTPIGVWNPANAAVSLSNNQVFGLTASELTSGSAVVSGTTLLAGQPWLDVSSIWQNPIPSVPGPTTIGAGPERLAFMMSEDAYQGNAAFTVSVDGTQIGGVETVEALHAIMQSQTFDVLGTFAPGLHTASITFTNDHYGGSLSQDRNLYLNGASINGTPIPDSARTLLIDGSKAITFRVP